MSYDPAARRPTPLAAKLAQRIRAGGALTVAAYMRAALGDPEHGYYRRREALGAAGDFVTAPEISQVFGELLGLWAVVAWRQMGAPAPFHLVELGPGRGSMMADALRAARLVPAFLAAARVVLVEPSPTLARLQRQRLAGAPASIEWRAHWSGIAPAPTILLANEVLDVLPVTQHVRAKVGWQERGVGLDADGRLELVTLPERPLLMLPGLERGVPSGAVIERADYKETAYALVRLAQGHPLAALFIDYGHEATAVGETLQAVRGHAPEHPLTSPGEADLTAHVDFERLAREVRGFGLAVDGPVTQAELLGALGVAERASRLMAENPRRAGEIEAGVGRLMAAPGMGVRFKAIGVRSTGLAPLPGLLRAGMR